MKKNIFTILFAALAMPVLAQETYDTAPIANEDLNGSARYVGMGGALEALGADISTINSNPAGIGLFRHNNINGSASTIFQHDAKEILNGKTSNISFDQLGFVYSYSKDNSSFINFAFNYHKSKNFNQILSAADNSLKGASQNKLTYIKAYKGVFDNNQDLTYSMVDELYMEHLLYNSSDKTYYFWEGKDYNFNRSNSGYIGEYDFNISGNSDNRFYWGITIGLHDVHYKTESNYHETYMPVDNSTLQGMYMFEQRKITGTGFDIKGGIIYRPILDSPLRIGAYIHTPTWYDLKVSASLNNSPDFSLDNQITYNDDITKGNISSSYDFKFFTPWRFGLSLGHTIGNFLALGLTYEYLDYGTCDMRHIDGEEFDPYYGTYHDISSSDNEMNSNIKQSLKAVSTLKLGIEYKILPSLAFRIGYNYLSPMYNKDGFKDGSLWSLGTNMSTSTDFTNWNSTNRITCGLGYKFSKFNFDFAYQYSQTKGDFTPFMNYYEGTNSSLNNQCYGVTVYNKRSQYLISVGYTF